MSNDWGVLALYNGELDVIFEAPMIFSEEKAEEIAQAVIRFRADQDEAPRVLIVRRPR